MRRRTHQEWVAARFLGAAGAGRGEELWIAKDAGGNGGEGIWVFCAANAEQVAQAMAQARPAAAPLLRVLVCASFRS